MSEPLEAIPTPSEVLEARRIIEAWRYLNASLGDASAGRSALNALLSLPTPGEGEPETLLRAEITSRIGALLRSTGTPLPSSSMEGAGTLPDPKNGTLNPQVAANALSGEHALIERHAGAEQQVVDTLSAITARSAAALDRLIDAVHGSAESYAAAAVKLELGS
jgi:hypothetical protein